jgi:hypothetical protein
LRLRAGDSPGVAEIAFIARDSDDSFRARDVAEVLNPPREMLERRARGAVVNHNGGGGIAEIDRRERAELFLTGGVPDLKLNGNAVDVLRINVEVGDDRRRF